MTNQTSRADRLIGLNEVMTLTAVSRSQIYNLISAQKFPPSMSLSVGSTNRCSRWSANEIYDWIEQIKSSRAAA